jgi:hypothetical protein
MLHPFCSRQQIWSFYVDQNSLLAPEFLVPVQAIDTKVDRRRVSEITS